MKAKISVHIALFTVALAYAILFSWAGQIMPNYIAADAFVWLRILTAAILFNIVGLLYIREKINWQSDGLIFFLCAFFGTACNMYMFFKGLSLTKPINAAVLMMVTPMFVAIFDHIRTKQTPKLETVLGLVIGSVGAGVLIAGKGASFTSQTLIGDIWVAVNAAFYAVYLVLVKPLVHKYNPMTVNRITFTMGTLIIAPLGLIPLVQTNFAIIPADIWMKIGYTLIITSFLVYLLNAFGVKHGSSALVGIYIYLQPVLATAIALFLGRDELTARKVFLTCTILFGVWLVMGSNKRRFSFKERFQAK